jgi:DNA-directed RNA polymerase subunit RPC12/RpoP
MDILFKCSRCQTELEVDADAAGEEIECPACNEQLVIPQPNQDNTKAPAPDSTPSRVEKKFSVPVTDRPVEALIKKPLPPLEAAATREGGRAMAIKTIRHSDCKEVGHDKFDLTVTEFLNSIGEESIVSITPVNYSYVEMGSQKLITDFGVMILFRTGHKDASEE